jgi:hypothetical protein
MKKIEDIQVTFIWGGKEATAFADVIYKTHRVDIGPQGHREHYMADVPYDMDISRVEVMIDGKEIKDEENLTEFATQLLLEEADYQLCEMV